MKKFSWFCLCLIVVLAAGCFAACDKDNKIETEEQMKNKVDAAMTAVILQVNVTENLTLPATSGNVAITWDSDKKNIISNTGVVTRPAFGANDEEVKLTGSFSYKDYSDTKVYTVSAKAINEKVFTFANGYTGDNAVLTAPEDGSYGSVTDKGDGVITLKPTESEGRKNAPYFKVSDHIPTWRGNGSTAEVMVRLDHGTMKTGGTFVIDFSINGKDNNWIGGIYLTFAVTDNNVVVTESQSPETEKFIAAPGWYSVGIKYYETDGLLNAKAFVKDAMGAELHTWTNTEFIGFMIPETTGEHEDVAISLIGGPRSIWFTDMNVNEVDVKKISVSYNS